jgi:hypothetical protein
MFEIEPIPDDHCVYRQIKNVFLKGGSLGANAFAEFELSVDWCKYSDPDTTIARVGAPGSLFPRDPADYGIAQLSVGDVRAIPQEVQHNPLFPIPLNRAHSLIIGKKGKPAKHMLTLKKLAIVIRQPANSLA